jgi:hypothetical protein
MPGKSKHGKRKQFRSSKKSKNLLRRDTIAAAPAATTAPAAVAAPRPSATAPAAPATKAAEPAAKIKADQYAYVLGDLRRIGVLSGIIVVILLVLYFFLA